MKIPIPLNYSDKLLLYNYYPELYFTPLKMKIPILLNLKKQKTSLTSIFI